MIYLVAYAKVTIDKTEGIELLGTFFGGVSPSEAEAEDIARTCVNNHKNTTILPLISSMYHPQDILEKLDQMHDRFVKKVKTMQETHQIISASSKIKKKKSKSKPT